MFFRKAAGDYRTLHEEFDAVPKSAPIKTLGSIAKSAHSVAPVADLISLHDPNADLSDLAPKEPPSPSTPSMHRRAVSAPDAATLQRARLKPRRSPPPPPKMLSQVLKEIDPSKVSVARELARHVFRCADQVEQEAQKHQAGNKPLPLPPLLVETLQVYRKDNKTLDKVMLDRSDDVNCAAALFSCDGPAASKSAFWEMTHGTMLDIYKRLIKAPKGTPQTAIAQKASALLHADFPELALYIHAK